MYSLSTTDYVSDSLRNTEDHLAAKETDIFLRGWWRPKLSEKERKYWIYIPTLETCVIYHSEHWICIHFSYYNDVKDCRLCVLFQSNVTLTKVNVDCSLWWITRCLHRLHSKSSTLAEQQQQFQSDQNKAKNASTQASFKHQLTDFHEVQKCMETSGLKKDWKEI